MLFLIIYRKMRAFNRVPCDESPLEIVAEIDPSLEYAGKTFKGSSRYSYLVRDNDRLKLLKVCACSDRIGNGENEGNIFRNLADKGVKGIPKMYKAYNDGYWWRGDSTPKYDPDKFSGSLVEYIDGDDFHERFRGPLVYARLLKMIWSLHRRGFGLPNDFSQNIRVDKKGQPYLIDFEQPEWDYLGDYFEKLPQMFKENCSWAWDRLKERIFKIKGEEAVV